MGAVHVAGEGREGPDPQGRAEGRGPELQGLREQAVRDGEQPVPVPGRGVPVEDLVRPPAQDRRGTAGVEQHLPADLPGLSGARWRPDRTGGA